MTDDDQSTMTVWIRKRLTSRQFGLLTQINAKKGPLWFDRRDANDLYALADLDLITVEPPRGTRLRAGEELKAVVPEKYLTKEQLKDAVSFLEQNSVKI